MNKQKEINTEVLQLRLTKPLKAILIFEARKRTTSVKKLLIRAFWAFLENEENNGMGDK